MEEVFQWLRDNGVKMILTVIVIDYIEPSHSDGAIERALGTGSQIFNIKTWDWKKLDLNCDGTANCVP
jgi:hypothetical protein